MKVSIEQINTTPCDFKGNLEAIVSGIHNAGAKECDLVVFPELTICGYLCKDLMYDEKFIDKTYESIGVIRDLSKQYPNLHIVIGYVDKNTKGIGKPFWNMASVVNNGFIIARYIKQLLPFYDVFDEGRYFEAGTETTVFSINDVKFGLTICEDLWNDKEQTVINYKENPVKKYRDLDVDCLINISSSPYCKDKPFKRQRMIDEVSTGFPLGVIYVNQVGGQDELVFDGCSTYSNFIQTLSCTRGEARYILDSGASSEGSGVCFEIGEGTTHSVESRDVVKHSNLYLKNMLVMGLSDYIKKSGFKSVVIGSSGGIDSALVACLASDAIGAENVHCIMMPSIYSSDHSLTDARELHKNLGCNEYEIPIVHRDTVIRLNEGLLKKTDYDKIADQNIQARIRGSYVMWFSNAYGALTLTTGNKTELAIGYATLYGDMCGGYAPISDLYKMEVYDIAKSFYSDYIPKTIIDKQPSAELAVGQFDVNDLLPYPLLDAIVEGYIEKNIHTVDKFKKQYGMDVDKSEYEKIILKVDQNEFKRRQYAPGTKVSVKAFGVGRRIPIVKGKKVF